MNQVNTKKMEKRMHARIQKNNLLKIVFLLATLFGLAVLAILLVRVITQGAAWLDWDFITGRLSTSADRAGIMGAILGTVWLMIVVIPVTLIIGVGSAIYLELYAKKGRIQSFIQTNISNLAGVPSIVYGLLGLTIFSRAMGLGNVV